MSLDVLLPIGGTENFPVESKSKIDTYQNRWNRHFHTLYGYSPIQNDIPFFQLPIEKLKNNPYWYASTMILSGDLDNTYFGLFDIANPFEWLSILAIAAQLKMASAADEMFQNANAMEIGGFDGEFGDVDEQQTNGSSATLQKAGAYLLQAAAFLFDALIRFPLGVAATLTCHAFDVVKALAAFLVASVTATVSQIGAEIGFATGLNEEFSSSRRRAYAEV